MELTDFNDKKYELTDTKKEIFGITVFQIRALKDFLDVKNGDLGGWVEKEDNLNQKGNGWIYENGIVIRGGEIHGGVIHGGVIRGGVIWGGLIWGGEIHGGDIHGGVILDGYYIKYNFYNKKNFDLKTLIKCALNLLPDEDGNYIMYKWVNKTDDGELQSDYDNDFKYEIGQYKEILDCNLDQSVSCGSGIHCSSLDYKFDGNTQIQLRVNINDIITCLEGKVRAKRVFVIREVNENAE